MDKQTNTGKTNSPRRHKQSALSHENGERRRLAIPFYEHQLENLERCAAADDLPLPAWCRLKLLEIAEPRIKVMDRELRQERLIEIRQESRAAREERQALAKEERARERGLKLRAKEEKVWNKERVKLGPLMREYADRVLRLPYVVDHAGDLLAPWRVQPYWEESQWQTLMSERAWLPEAMETKVVVVENAEWIQRFEETFGVNLSLFLPAELSERVRWVFTPEWHDSQGIDYLFVRIPRGPHMGDIAVCIKDVLWLPIERRVGAELADWLAEKYDWVCSLGAGVLDNYVTQNKLYVGDLPQPMGGVVPKWATMRLGLDG